jgi:hypothetical protein
MRCSTPFFKEFGSLLFGRPPVSALAQAQAKIRESDSLSLLANVFGSYLPKGLLGTGVGVEWH